LILKIWLFVYFREHRALLEKCAQTTLSSKLIARQREFFAKMVVDTVLMLDDLLPLNMYVFHLNNTSV
jgi:chaperonin GroEL (HSP60 family)